MRILPGGAGRVFLLLFSILLADFVRRPNSTGVVMRLRKIVVVGAILFAIRDTATFYFLCSQGVIVTQFPIPFSLLIAALLVAMQVRLQEAHKSRRSWVTVVVATMFCAVAFPLLQIQCFGWTDYRRPADAAVVFGCKVYANGKPSVVFEDRVRSACDLYRMGLVNHLVMSGGPGQGAVHETVAMRDLAISLGVPHVQILLDLRGSSTDETVTNTVPLFRQHGFERVLAVSHFFHLPRIKLAYQRAGVNVFTVPASQTFRLPNENFMLIRETVALWAYYARPLTGI